MSKKPRPPLRIVAAASPAHWAAARAMVREYAGRLDVNLEFQNFSEELARLETHYGPPMGAFLLAQNESGFIGCVGLRKHSTEAAEMKRLYVAPAAQGSGVGRALAGAIIERARRLGYKHVLLDTLPSMTTAQALYRSLGFRPIPAYRHNPVPGAAYMELKL